VIKVGHDSTRIHWTFHVAGNAAVFSRTDGSAAKDLNYPRNDESAELRLDLAGAYPKTANLESWVRTLHLDRTRDEIEITDEYVLKTVGAKSQSAPEPRAKPEQCFPGRCCLSFLCAVRKFKSASELARQYGSSGAFTRPPCFGCHPHQAGEIRPAS
jgi:hypothetical protein